MNKFCKIMAFFSILLAVPTIAQVVGVSENSVKLGMVNAQSGPAAGLGKGMRVGIEAYFKHVNEQGGVHGRKLELFVSDDGYEPEKTVDETLKILEEKQVFALVGYVGTPTANAVLPIVKEMKVPLVGLFTGAMSLRSPVTKEVFNVRASYDDEAEKLVEHFIKVNGAKRFAVFYQDDGFGLAVLSGTEKALKRRNMEVVAKGVFQRNTTAVKTGLATMVNANPDVVIMVGPYTPLSVFVKEARQNGLKSNLATVSFVGTENFANLLGAEGEGIVISQVVPFPDDASLPIVKECRQILSKYAASDKLGYVNFEGCVTAKVFVSLLEKAGKNLTRETLIETAESFNRVDLGGLVVGFSNTNHQASNTVFLTQIKAGKVQSIK